MKVVASEFYCLMAVAQHLQQGVQMRVWSEGAGIINIAALVSMLEEEAYDKDTELLISAKGYEGLTKKHLVKEYLKNEDTNQVYVRYRTTPCPHTSGQTPNEDDVLLRSLDSITTVGQ